MRILIIIIALLAVQAQAFCANFKIGEKLYTIETKHFDIIFSEGSRRSAECLAGFADGVFDDITARLSYTNQKRIPVVITPSIGLFNGYTYPVPYIHIVLWDYPLDPEWTTFRDNLKSLFTHELTHAVTMDIKSPFFEFLYSIFGSPFDFGLGLEPEYMIEGAAVSFESGGGYGRANDPLIQERLREDIYENVFMSPLQASGAWDIYPYGNVYYNYGGLFNKYLQDRFGMEKYSEYWHDIAGLRIYGPDTQVTESDYWYYSYYFEAVFGVPFTKLWADFKNSLSVKDVSDNTNILSAGYYSIVSPVMSHGRIYFIDSFKSRVMSYSVKDKKYGVVIDNAAGFNSIDVSPDGRKMLICMNGEEKGLYRNIAVYYDLEKNVFTGGSMEGLYSACFFNEGLAALEADGHRNILVYIEGGKQEKLVEGTESVIISGPVRFGDNRIAFLAADHGDKKLMAFDIKTHELFVMRPAGKTRVDYMRSLSSSDGKLLFGYNTDHEFYRLGLLDGNVLKLQTNNFSGGVFYPLLDNGSIYYVGRFSRGDRLMKYPGGEDGFKGLAAAAAFEKAESFNTDIIIPASSNKIEGYCPLKYMSPLQCWLIIPTSYSFPHTNDFTIDSVGIETYMSDPVDENTFLIILGYNYLKNFVNGSGRWNYSGDFPLDFGIEAFDKMSFDFRNYSYYRETLGSIGLNYTYNLLPYNNYIFIGAGAGYYTVAPDTLQAGSGYLWPFIYTSAIASGSAGFSTLLYTDKLYEERGISFTGYADYAFNYDLYKIEGSFLLGLPFIFSHINLYGAYCPAPVLNTVSWNPYFGGGHYPGNMEFASEPLQSDYYLSLDYSLLLFDAELQNGWFPFYFNRLLMTAGWRGIYLADNFRESVYARIDLQLSAATGVIVTILNDLYFDAAYNISSNSFYFMAGFNIPFPSL